jgi:hypothetical protein
MMDGLGGNLGFVLFLCGRSSCRNGQSGAVGELAQGGRQLRPVGWRGLRRWRSAATPSQDCRFRERVMVRPRGFGQPGHSGALIAAMWLIFKRKASNALTARLPVPANNPR